MAIGADRQELVSPPVDSPGLYMRGLNQTEQRMSTRWAVVPLFALDAVCVLLSLAAAYYLRFQVMEYHAPLSLAVYIHLALIAIPMWILIFALSGLYQVDRLFGGLREYGSVFNACTYGVMGLTVYSFFNRRAEYDVSRGWLLLVWVFSLASVALARFSYRRLIYALRRRGFFMERALVVGANEEGKVIASQLCSSPISGMKIVGFVDSSFNRGERVDGLRVWGNLGDLDDLVETLGVDELIIIPTALRRQELLDIYRDWGTDRRVRILLSSGLYELFTTGAEVRGVGFVPLVSLNRTRITGMDAAMKMALDYVGAFVGLILLFPVFLILAILIRKDSEGSVFHRRRVVGLHGKRFDAFKFRTMIPDADMYLESHPELKEEWERTGKIEDDPRITRMGRVLRHYSLDELPQLFNVLMGQMSLVGPRMITPAELRHFRRWRHNLLTVKPGMTGLWQVNGRSDVSYDERVRMDMDYIRNYTIWLDLKLLLNTAGVVFKGEGAY